MKTNNMLKFLKSGIKQKVSINQIILTLTIFLFNGTSGFAQNTVARSMNDIVSNWILGGLGVVFIGILILIVNNALSVLHENGRTIEFSFPIAKEMARNSKTVGTIILILILTGIVFAIKYGV